MILKITIQINNLAVKNLDILITMIAIQHGLVILFLKILFLIKMEQHY